MVFENTNINEEKVKKLSGCFSNVAILMLSDCELSSESVKILSNTINHNKTKVGKLFYDLVFLFDMVNLTAHVDYEIIYASIEFE